MICTTDFIDIFGFFVLIFFGAFLGRFLARLGGLWGVFLAGVRPQCFLCSALHY